MKLTIARNLAVVGIAVSVGMFASFGLQQAALERLKVNGPIYEQIVYGKDLIADILPPPLFVVESYMLSHEANDFPDLIDANLAKIATLKAAYDDRRAYWRTTRLPQSLKDELDKDVLAKGDIFWKVMEEDVIPALKARKDGAASGSMVKLRTAFHEHQDAVEKLVVNSDTYLKGQEKNAADEIMTWTSAAAAAALASFLLLLGGLYFFRRRAILPIDGMKRYMSGLANGDFSEDVPFAERSDEIGQMAQAVVVFRTNSLERREAHLREAGAKEAEIARERQLASERASEEAARDAVIQSLTQGLDELSRGNLGFRIDTRFPSAYEELRAAFNSSVDTLSSSIDAVSGATSTLRHSSQDIAGAMEALAKRTEQQAATIEETSAALTEITSAVGNSSSQSAEASRMTGETSKAALQCAELMREAIAAMQRIEGSSDQIGSIINVIDDIAFQTNLLALNAGVEAARAGEAGKGFAVVAQEVRELASRSANAAKEIKVLVSTSSDQVGAGVALVNRTGEALSDIETGVQHVGRLIDAVVTSLNAQSSAIGEINGSIHAMDEVTQRNSAMATETSSACKGLNEQVLALEEIVSRFRIAAVRPGVTASRAA
ncbi:methyl-accepting chemotaxis protein [Rhizobium sp. BK529]|uniref:methyl-accepting chemotaxis protein n=1 Tax=unclassified Rhizobium TaxID=2613769 RepID=UPI00104A6ED7|nr:MULTISPECIES: HAMP domain-containing methyl-accepting chemotaxis protein [unclassified Rhizobium]MBB3590805.1 methyl-accepting chemotaxis protein [Rhizobium sp. BK529]TCS09240.1 methyl-accepting chemotaxis protein [Rhizobium sp. BK418]